MVKNAHNPDLYNYFNYQFNEEQTHPDLAKRFGLALGLHEEDFQNASQIFECFAHTSKTIRGMLLGSPGENRVSGLVDETMVQRYSEEFDANMRGHYNLGDSALQFFLVHKVADEDHIRMASEIISRYTDTPRWSNLCGKRRTMQSASSSANSTVFTVTTLKISDHSGNAISAVC